MMKTLVLKMTEENPNKVVYMSGQKATILNYVLCI